MLRQPDVDGEEHAVELSAAQAHEENVRIGADARIQMLAFRKYISQEAAAELSRLAHRGRPIVLRPVTTGRLTLGYIRDEHCVCSSY